MRMLLGLLLSVPLCLFLTSCGGQVPAEDQVAYKFEYGRSALLQDGIAYAPKNAPAAVHRAIAAGNRLQDKPYKWGGGHAVLNDSGYDCSGAVSYVLREAGLMRGQMPSKGFFNYGDRGAGRWITVYVRNGHVFLTVAGLRLDTGWGGGRKGPRWQAGSRPGRGHVVRHPSGY
jgi:hypothetical protein